MGVDVGMVFVGLVAGDGVGILAYDAGRVLGDITANVVDIATNSTEVGFDFY